MNASKTDLLHDLESLVACYTQIETDHLQNQINALHRWRKACFLENYHDYFQQARYQAALHFILSDVYPDLTHQPRDLKIAKAFTSMQRILPDKILQTIARAVHYKQAILLFDVALVSEGDEQIDTTTIQQKIQAMPAAQQEHQRLVNLFCELTQTIHVLVKNPFIRATLKASRLPAKAANLMELQDFLERCFAVFKTLRDPSDFLKDYQQRELKILSY